MSTKPFNLDKQTIREIGRELWRMRQEKHMYIHAVARRTNLPERIIEGMEIGKFIKFSAIRRLTEFYGKKMRITFEDQIVMMQKKAPVSCRCLLQNDLSAKN
ncbi:MAG: hypothetical protein IJ778_04045 [Alphaproteobacteria bacterium]|jgi:hypothetical protein|nr:hypothetical protein [Alphaproteobacteria bacterium]